MVVRDHHVSRLERQDTSKDAKRDVVHRASAPTRQSPNKRKPEGPGRFGPNPPAFGSPRRSALPFPQTSSLSQFVPGSIVPGNHEGL